MLGAVLGAGAISGLGSFLGGREASKGADAAFKLEKQRIAELRPFLDAGKEALGQYQAGINDIPTMASLMGYVQSDPGYQFQLEQGMNALEGSAAARGNLLSGNTLKAIQGYGQDLASQYTDKILNRGLTLQGTRQNQLQQLMSGALTAGGRNALPELAMAKGNARAGIYEGVGNAATSTLGNLMMMKYLGD